jgi:hypothetical protein
MLFYETVESACLEFKRYYIDDFLNASIRNEADYNVFISKLKEKYLKTEEKKEI